MALALRLDVPAGELPVPPIAAGAHARSRELERTRERRQRTGVELGTHAAPRGELVDVPEQPEPGDVRHGVRLEAADDVRGREVQLEHRLDRRVERAVGSDPVTLRLEDDPGAEALRQEKHVAGDRAGLRPDPLWVHGSDDGEAVLRLGVANRVAARQNRAGLTHLRVRTREHLAEHLHRKLLGERGHGQCEQRPAAHCEDVVERIRRRDRAERARVVDQRRKEVDGEHDRALVVEPVDRGVVGGIEADEQILRVGGHESGEERLEPAGGVLRRAPSGLRERRESDGLHAEHCTRKEFPRGPGIPEAGEILPLLLSP